MLKRIAIGIVAVLVLLVAVAYLLPRQVQVSRQVVINATPEAIFPHLNSLKATAKWSPWLARDPKTKVTYQGPETGVGAGMAWSSDHPDVGSGKQVIAASDPNRRVATLLDFGDMGTAKAEFLLHPKGDGTEVTWQFETDMGPGPIGRYFGLMMDGMVGGDYEKGLANLKALVEGG